MTSPPEERYTIVEQEPSDAIKRDYPDLAYTLFVVWDRKLNRRVPFGNYRDRVRAQGRIDKLKARDGGTERA